MNNISFQRVGNRPCLCRNKRILLLLSSNHNLVKLAIVEYWMAVVVMVLTSSQTSIKVRKVLDKPWVLMAQLQDLLLFCTYIYWDLVHHERVELGVCVDDLSVSSYW